jgi:transposase
LARIVRTGWYKEVTVKSLDSHRIRTLLTSRAQLVNMRRDVGSKIRGLLKTFGKVVGKVGDRGYQARVRELAAGEAGLEDAVSALLAVCERLEQQIGALETRILSFAKHSNPCRRLMTISGVGALTAVSFITAVDDPARFQRSSGVGAYFGLIPVAISLDLSVPAFAAQFGLRTTPRIGVSFYANGYQTAQKTRRGLPTIICVICASVAP